MSQVPDGQGEATIAEPVDESANAGPRRILQSLETNQPVGITLEPESEWLWRKFLPLPTEMVVTRQGRRMFPVVSVSVTGLRPEAMYTVYLDMILVNNHRWKYVRGDWVVGGKADPPHPTIYKHPDSPHYGSHWMKSPIVFNKVKLTNKQGEGGHLVLNSLHKYEARVHIVPEQGQRLQPLPCIWRSFPDTRFIAVTAYQNEAVTQLKIQYNPYARAFTEANKKPTGTHVPEVSFNETSYQPLCPRQPFSEQVDENEGISEAEDMHAEYEYAGPHATASAPPTMKRDEDMEVDITARNNSMPPVGAPHGAPSTYAIEGSDGRITYYGPGGSMMVEGQAASPPPSNNQQAFSHVDGMYHLQQSHMMSTYQGHGQQSSILPMQNRSQSLPPLHTQPQIADNRYQYATLPSPNSPPQGITYQAPSQLSPQSLEGPSAYPVPPNNPSSPGVRVVSVSPHSGINYSPMPPVNTNNSFPLLYTDQAHPLLQASLHTGPTTLQTLAVGQVGSVEKPSQTISLGPGGSYTL